MAPPRRAFDLKAVEKLFRDTLEAVRDDTPDTEGLKSQAIEWLKAARYKITVRELKSAFVNLHVRLRPRWADGLQPLYLSTPGIPTLLQPPSELKLVRQRPNTRFLRFRPTRTRIALNDRQELPKLL
ncbi:hypothetical protein DFH08DRAFT_1083033 [Mycena albidolilacea]|uniref:Uncharacterized protein n=1 Tax=Mycena albidolilacea TaxID=1033008 RepID=A0AAD6ZRG8_9AGAR|nr:hypothetical protein DFH08DRAFT_1083033 [Mycena albidolilacea]